MQELLIRVDANENIGIGHAMRCLALGEAWQHAGGAVTWASAFRTPAIERRAAARGFVLRHLSAEPGSHDDAQQLISMARMGSPAAVVVDGYVFGYEYQDALKRAGLRLLCIDDYGHAGRYCADVVLNQNLWATEQFYELRDPATILLLGSEYVLLRREFPSIGVQKREFRAVARRLLVTLGGGDAHNVTLKIIQAIAKLGIRDLEAIVVAGPANSNVALLRRAIEESALPINLEEDAESMPHLMNWADLAISAAGSTCWEMAFLGLPAIVVVTAENQEPCAAKLHQMGIVSSLGSYRTLEPASISDALEALMRSPEVRMVMSSRGQALIDGRGAQRVAAVLGG